MKKVTLTKELVDSIVRALNAIPNQKGIGTKGESSYDIASKLGDELSKQKGRKK